MTAPNKIHGKTQEAWQKHCFNKRRYSDDTTARISAQYAINHYPETPRYLSTYKCENCRGWHMTKYIKGDAPIVTADDLYYTGEI